LVSSNTSHYQHWTDGS